MRSPCATATRWSNRASRSTSSSTTCTNASVRAVVAMPDEDGPARTDGERIDANRAMWDERVPIHVASDFYGLDSFKAHPDRIRPFEADEMGDVTGRDLV